MSLFLTIFLAVGFFTFGYFSMLIVADAENEVTQQIAIVSGLLSSTLFFVILDIYNFL